MHSIGVVQDVTERKRVEMALRESEERQRAGIQLGKLALANIDYSTNRVNLTDESAAMFGTLNLC